MSSFVLHSVSLGLKGLRQIPHGVRTHSVPYDVVSVLNQHGLCLVEQLPDVPKIVVKALLRDCLRIGWTHGETLACSVLSSLLRLDELGGRVDAAPLTVPVEGLAKLLGVLRLPSGVQVVKLLNHL